MLLDRGVVVRAGDGYQVTGAIAELEIPESLHALVAARLDGLSEDERRLLQQAAVLGKSFTLDGLAAIGGMPRDQAEEVLAALARKELVSVQTDPRSPERGQYGFVQDMVRTIARDTLGRRERKRLHLATADHLARLGGDELAEVIAAHRVDAYRLVPDDPDAAGLRDAARADLLRASERAASLAAPAEAFRLVTVALDLVADDRGDAALHEQAGVLALRKGDVAEAERAVQPRDRDPRAGRRRALGRPRPRPARRRALPAGPLGRGGGRDGGGLRGACRPAARRRARPPRGPDRPALRNDRRGGARARTARAGDRNRRDAVSARGALARAQHEGPVDDRVHEPARGGPLADARGAAGRARGRCAAGGHARLLQSLIRARGRGRLHPRLRHDAAWPWPSVPAISSGSGAFSCTRRSPPSSGATGTRPCASPTRRRRPPAPKPTCSRAESCSREPSSSPAAARLRRPARRSPRPASTSPTATSRTGPSCGWRVRRRSRASRDSPKPRRSRGRGADGFATLGLGHPAVKESFILESWCEFHAGDRAAAAASLERLEELPRTGGSPRLLAHRSLMRALLAEGDDAGSPVRRGGRSRPPIRDALAARVRPRRAGGRGFRPRGRAGRGARDPRAARRHGRARADHVAARRPHGRHRRRLRRVPLPRVARYTRPVRSELLKGHLDLLLLTTLRDEPAHGYAVLQRLTQLSGGEFDLPEGTIYPALHRLERGGLLSSEKSIHRGRTRRTYRLTPAGERAMSGKRTEWERFAGGNGAHARGARMSARRPHRRVPGAGVTRARPLATRTPAHPRRDRGSPARAGRRVARPPTKPLRGSATRRRSRQACARPAVAASASRPAHRRSLVAVAAACLLTVQASARGDAGARSAPPARPCPGSSSAAVGVAPRPRPPRRRPAFGSTPTPRSRAGRCSCSRPTGRPRAACAT